MSKFRFTILIYCCVSLLFSPASLAGKQKTQAPLKEQDNDKILRYPIGCVPIGYRFDLYNIIFTPSNKFYTQSVYFIHNISKENVKMLHAADENAPYVVHVNGEVAAGRWSVLAATEKQIKYICSNFDKKTKEHQVINCKDVLDICEFPAARFGTNHRGTYWIAQNQGQKEVQLSTKKFGVLLIDPQQKDGENP